MKFQLKDELIAQLEAIAKREKVSLDSLIEWAVEKFIEEDNSTEYSPARKSVVNTIERNNFMKKK